jgi:hypothetical protein
MALARKLVRLPFYASFLSGRTRFVASVVDKGCLSTSYLNSPSMNLNSPQHMSMSSKTVQGSDEVQAAHRAAAASTNLDDAPTIFDKIISKEIPANIIYEVCFTVCCFVLCCFCCVFTFFFLPPSHSILE